MRKYHFNYLLVAGLIFFMISILGCYTMLHHPMIVETTEAEDDHPEPMEVDHRQDCMQCHQSPHQRSFIYGYYDFYHEPGWSPGWQYFYDTPWWMNDFYYSSSQGNDENNVPRPTDFGRRRRTGDTSDSENSGISRSGSGSSGGWSGSSLAKKKSDSSSKRSSEETSGKRTVSRRQRSSSDDEESNKKSETKKRKN